jgi:hypothetical protein
MKKNKRSSNDHTWRFFRAGGFDQVRLDSAADLLALDTLDQKLWVALACPVDNVFFDTHTLALIDTDGDRRVRAPELIAAIKWTAGLLKNQEDLVDPGADFTLQSINDANDEGKSLATAMQSALAALNKKESDPLSIAEIDSLEKVLSQKPFNGDGVITEQTATDDGTRALIKEIIAVFGAVADRSGQPGINAEKAAAFFTQARVYEAWVAESNAGQVPRPLGDTTEQAARAILAVRNKINDYFTRCSLAAFDEKAAPLLNGSEKHYETIGGKMLSFHEGEIGELPLAKIQPLGALPLKTGLNPAWAEKIALFDSAAIRPVLGSRESLTEAEWQGLCTTFVFWLAWLERKPETPIDALGIGRVRELLRNAAEKTIAGLIEKDTSENTTIIALSGLEKLVRFRRDLHALCTNFVNFKDFYSRGGGAIFQAGTLFLDQRSCHLCLKIDDAAKHAVMAAMAGTYLVYCECKRPGAAKMTIVAAFTNGDSENIITGRNGVFYDRAGKDWDATVVKIIENPISLRQAFWLPYKSFVRMVETQVAKRASAAEAQSTSKLEQTATATANVDAGKPPVTPPKKLDIGIVAALGVAAGALGTFVATLLGYVSGIIKLGPLAIGGAIIGLLFLISGPSLILAYIKLRKRNLGPILDASGWAVNAKARINVPFGTLLTHIAALPPGSQRDLADPYAEKKSPWPKIIIMAILVYIAWAVLNHFGFIYDWTGGRIGNKPVVKETTIIEKNVPVK